MANRILYVEDSFNNTLLVKRIVQAEGHEFLSAVDGESGWLMALNQPPDLIFVDLRLPGEVDGLALIRRLKADPSFQDVPTVVITAYGHSEVAAQATEAGCDGFLLKPADIVQIRAMIRRYVGSPELEAKPTSDRSTAICTAPLL